MLFVRILPVIRTICNIWYCMTCHIFAFQLMQVATVACDSNTHLQHLQMSRLLHETIEAETPTSPTGKDTGIERRNNSNKLPPRSGISQDSKQTHLQSQVIVPKKSTSLMAYSSKPGILAPEGPKQIDADDVLSIAVHSLFIMYLTPLFLA